MSSKDHQRTIKRLYLCIGIKRQSLLAAKIGHFLCEELKLETPNTTRRVNRLDTSKCAIRHVKLHNSASREK